MYITIGPVERDLEWLAHPGHTRLLLALHSCTRSGAHSIYRLHLYQRYALSRFSSAPTPDSHLLRSVFEEMKFALNALPETLINMLQSSVSLRRIEKYLHGAEVAAIPPLPVPTPSLATTPLSSQPIALQNATITWPQDRTRGTSTAPSVASTPRQKFMLVDLSLNFPVGELSLVCGKLGSGKTLLLLALLGEADLLTGQVACPRSPPDALARFAVERVSEEDWIVPGICAYVPQVCHFWFWCDQVSI